MPVKYKIRLSVIFCLSHAWRNEAEKRAYWWANLLEINEIDIYDLPFPNEATNSVNGVDLAVKKNLVCY